jgi:phosphoribosylaminoimidazole-succinocarboxamide synthase
VPEQFAGRAIRCQRLEMVPVECIARGYLTGLGLSAYNETGTVSGVALPPGLVEASRLPEPVFTPTTKAAAGHDEPMTFEEVAALMGEETAQELRRVTLEVYRRGAELAAGRGLIVADTKLEFGRAPDGTLVLGDEVLTPDSSRFWSADSYQPGRVQKSFDKQYLRDWSTSIGWDRTAPGPEIPPDVLAVLTARYAELYQRVTGEQIPA